MSSSSQLYTKDAEGYLEEIETSSVDHIDAHEDLLLSEIELQFEENMRTLNLILGAVICPTIGRYFGRKFSFWIWKRIRPLYFASAH
ncbi:hypothetical protein CONCODRAFT_18004 [Conidiobolus coronatus NRRL 28638]|uniref:Uncharacterized protein n=1 Tax=Conidiobolus coronatus (strain ATCC 28846 / CBS 209.66 / NRRL 28638) TaxID=796925 RepID=A0A137P4F5_CONC2|nr:hypothetical protein CONCODRAFT_18004 [Conidiobolus coronatus NRRL 28638]|eukprot:KXN69895.1 hypothetical protein CONCODRAFT_18004 [Conidiobolus coronatus NRRL 28638]